MPMLRIAGCAGASGTFAERNGTALEHQVRIRGGITTSILRFVPSPSHGLISLVPWEPTASLADLETAAVNSPRILTGTPYSSGGTQREQGISKDGNRRLRATLVELAWMGLRYQPGCALSRWFHDRLGGSRGRLRKVMIVALARKLLVALWRYLQDGAVPQRMELKPA